MTCHRNAILQSLSQNHGATNVMELVRAASTEHFPILGNGMQFTTQKYYDTCNFSLDFLDFLDFLTSIWKDATSADNNSD